MPEISVILPVYNSNKHLDYCITSIINQTFKDFELFIVDDGSTDDTFSRCERFAKKDARIKVVRKTNEGIEKARIFGIENSKGKYLVFCDHDDWYSKNALEKLYETAVTTHSEIVVARYKEVINSWFPFSKEGFNLVPPQVVGHKEFIQKFYSNFFGYNQFSVSTWGKIYARHLFNKKLKTLGFNPTEDVALNIQIFPKASKIAFIEDTLYFHRFGGLSSKPNVKILLKNYEMLYYLKLDYLQDFPLKNSAQLMNIELKNIIVHFIKTSLITNQLSHEEIGNYLNSFRNTEVNKLFEAYYRENFDNDHFLESFYVNYTQNNWSAIIDSMRNEVRAGKYKLNLKIIVNHILSWIN